MLQNLFNEKLRTGRADKKAGGLSAKTLKNMRCLLNVAMQQACNDRLISFNPVDGVRLPIPDSTEQRVFTPKEKERICAYTTNICTPAAQGILILLACGLRRGELLGLRWEDIDLANGTMKIRHTVSRLKKFDVSQSAYHYIRLDDYAPETNQTAVYLGPVKTKKAVRTIFLPQRAKSALKRVRQISSTYANHKLNFNPYNLVFCTEDGHPLDAKVLEDAFFQILADLNLERANLHATRHTFATDALQKTTDLIAVSEILGHAKPSTTLDMYGHTFDERKRALMAQM